MRDWLTARLADLAASSSLRDPEDSQLHSAPRAPGDAPWLDACSNDYLGLGAHHVSRETLNSVLNSRIGAGAARLVQGTFAEHLSLEEEIADWLGTESSLLTTSAFAANVGLLPALADADTLVVSDALNHASIVDGCRLSRARVVVTPHLDLGAVEAALRGRQARETHCWVVTESLFSMDGDGPDMRELRHLCDRFEAGLIVDEAHALGVVGQDGAGACRSSGVVAEVVVAGLGKAVGAQGGALAVSRELRRLLWNRQRAFVFSTAPSPVLSALTLLQVRAARTASAARELLRQRVREVRARLAASGLASPSTSESPIVPVVLGTNERALRAMALLRSRGILVQAIRPPTVPAGSARLRLTVHADWPDDAAARLVDALEVACA